MRAMGRFLVMATISVLFIACGGGGDGKSQQVQIPDPPVAPVVTVSADIKQLIFSWEAIATATHYRLLENPDGHSGFTQVGGNIPSAETSVVRDIAVHLHDWVNALYMIQACNTGGCTASTEISATGLMLETIGTIHEFGSPYLSADGEKMAVTGKDGFHVLTLADNQPAMDFLIHDYSGGGSALSADGLTLAIACPDIPSLQSSEVFVYRFDGSSWSELAVLGGAEFIGEFFGSSISLSGNGDILAIGAKYADYSPIAPPSEDFSYDTGSGAVYIFQFDGTEYVQQARLVPLMSGPRPFSPSGWGWPGIHFGNAVSLSDNGQIIAVGAINDVGAGEADLDVCRWDLTDQWRELDCRLWSGAVHVFAFDGSQWNRQAYIKAANRKWFDRYGSAIKLSGDGTTLAVGSPGEDSQSTGINGEQLMCCVYQSGAVYVYGFDGLTWYQQAYVKPSNTKLTKYNEFNPPAPMTGYEGMRFGSSVAMSSLGDLLMVSAPGEDSNADGVNGDQDDGTAWASGAVYVFERIDALWAQVSYVKDYDSRQDEGFGGSISVSADGTILAVKVTRYDEGQSASTEVVIY